MPHVIAMEHCSSASVGLAILHNQHMCDHRRYYIMYQNWLTVASRLIMLYKGREETAVPDTERIQ